jgi:hypothetical protein
MPTPTYTPLANVTLGTASTSVTFSSIPATYRDLIVVITARNNAASTQQISVRPNADTANGTRIVMFGDGSSTGSGADTNLVMGTLPTSSSQYNQFHLDVFDYQATDKHKSMLSKARWAAVAVDAQALRWASTSAITSLVFVTPGSFDVGSTFNLYGVIA